MPHTNQTKLMLAQSLRDLMTTQPLEKITINDIVDHAGVGRNTFYYHFEDKYALVNWYFQSGVTEFLTEHGSFTGWRSLLEALEAYFRENQSFYTNALNYSGQNSLREQMYLFLHNLFCQRIKAARPDLEEQELQFAANFFTGGILVSLLRWIHGGMKEDVCDHYEMIHSLCTGDLMQILLQMNDLEPLFVRDPPQ